MLGTFVRVVVILTLLTATARAVDVVEGDPNRFPYVFGPGIMTYPAERTVYFYSMPLWGAHCGTDLARYCPGYLSEGYRGMICLGSHLNMLTPECRAAF